MKHDYQYKELYSILSLISLLMKLAVHRLDKLTSGLLILSKSQDLAFKFQDDLKNNKVEKTYLARVYGNFPGKEGEEITVEKSIWCVSPKLSKYDFCKNEEEEQKGKYAKTVFKKIWYDEKTNSSLVECKPVTGKTHQIRVHCKSLGCSIINDINYGGPFVGNLIESEILGKNIGHPPSENISGIVDLKGKEIRKPPIDPDIEKGPSKKLKTTSNSEEVNAQAPKEEVSNNGEKEEEETKELHQEEKTTEIKQEKALTSTIDEKKKEELRIEELDENERTYVMEIWLHSIRYKYREKEFEAPSPYWAKKEFPFSVKELVK
jgi:hypothetical protein